MQDISTTYNQKLFLSLVIDELSKPEPNVAFVKKACQQRALLLSLQAEERRDRRKRTG